MVMIENHWQTNLSNHAKQYLDAMYDDMLMQNLPQIIL